MADLSNTSSLLNQGFDVVLVAVDQEKERRCGRSRFCAEREPATPMAYSSRTDDDMLIRCMRAGFANFFGIRLHRA